MESSYKLFNPSGLWTIYLFPNIRPEIMRKKCHYLLYAIFDSSNLSVDVYSKYTVSLLALLLNQVFKSSVPSLPHN